MTVPDRFEIFLAAPPGLEAVLREEAIACGFSAPKAVAGGVTFEGRWREVWRANLLLRGPSHVLARIAQFPALHLAQLDKRARDVPWRAVLRRDQPFRVEASCSRSRIYHSGAAAQRIATAIAQSLGAPAAADAEVVVKARFQDDLCTVSVETSGAALHRRGAKEAVGKAPMRENLAALVLRACGYDGNEPVVDPMCGSGTFVIEAAEIACGLAPGRARRFAFESLATFDPAQWAALKAAAAPRQTALRFHGSDRDAGAIRMSTANAARAGVAAVTAFARHAVSDCPCPEGPPGLVIVNPPYGARLGEKKPLFALYGALGQMLKSRFAGWRVGLVSGDAALARATGLAFAPEPLVFLHGGLRVKLFRSGPLA